MDKVTFLQKFELRFVPSVQPSDVVPFCDRTLRKAYLASKQRPGSEWSKWLIFMVLRSCSDRLAALSIETKNFFVMSPRVDHSSRLSLIAMDDPDSRNTFFVDYIWKRVKVSEKAVEQNESNAVRLMNREMVLRFMKIFPSNCFGGL